MIIRYPKNIFKQIAIIVRQHYIAISCFTLLGSAAYVLIKLMNFTEASLPVVPVTILGGGLAIFLGFRNNAAYDRWWEARKIWGAIVNSSRTLGTKVITFMTLRHTNRNMNEQELKLIHKRILLRHIAYINVLRLQLRELDKWDLVKGYIQESEFNLMTKAPNEATFLNHQQGIEFDKALNEGVIEDFRHMSLMEELAAFYDHQGKCERIKKTVFPFYYTYFTTLFLWLFIILLPFSLVQHINYFSVPISVAISFVFFILDKTGRDIEEPFENRAADTPMKAICNTIERDLLFMIEEENLPEASTSQKTRLDVEYIE